MNVLGRLAAAGRVEIAAAGRAAADEDRVETLGEHRLEALDASRGDERSPGRQRVANLLVDHFVRQTELRNLAAHHAAGARVGIEHNHVIADCGEIAGDRQRGRPRADATDALSVARSGGLRQAISNVTLAVGGDAFEAANGDRLFLQASASAGGLAWTIAGSSQDSREDVRLPINEIGAVVVAIGDAANVLGDGRVRRAGPLAIDHSVEVIGMRDISRLHEAVVSLPSSTGICQNCLARIQTRFVGELSENNDKVILTL